MREPPRRRRGDDEPSGRGLPLFPLILVVVLAGLLLGGVLAHFFGGSAGAPRPEKSAVAQAPAPSETPSPGLSTPMPSPAATPSHRPTARPSPAPTTTLRPTVAPSSSATPAASVAPQPSAAPTPRAVQTKRAMPPPPATPARVAAARTATPTAKPVAEHAAPATPSQDDVAAAVVRSYLGALGRGDSSTARSFLASGSPSESFMNGESQIESIRSAPLSGSQYRVTADVKASSGEYFETFTVAPGPGGLQIVDHYWIKPQ